MIRLPPEEKQQTPEQERTQKLAEVAGLVARGLDPTEAAGIVAVDLTGQTLPRKSSFMPSPAEIASQCLTVQAGWTPRERVRRRAGLVQRYVIPLVRCADIGF
ncbi:hypothetical protein Poly24_06650 [Rosistilla carotiformis]|uniref:Uncharacterized protein n=1 Tax=Rosistilla carotiformis TaxID=2528017 RepID=A0A518JN43_9BACT|nr:hypothetical protein [Rosistilla carotiformis]QDV66975.1 hypothetical protein Poly24_06650 [Rosistilla carotiformis]